MQSVIATPTGGARLRVVGDVVCLLASSKETGGSCEEMGKIFAVAMRHGFTLPA